MPQLGPRVPAETLRRFWGMLAHTHGQIWGASEFARSFGMSDVTVRRYLDLLSSLFLVRQLLPWHENLGKGLVKSPKLGFEFKRTVAPEITKSMRIAPADLRLERLDVNHAGERTFPLAERVRAVAPARALQDIVPLR